MSDDPTRPSEHPDELLATYVDGTASPLERDAAEAHLATCAACRADVEMAGRARAAVAGLPALSAPGLAAEVLAKLEPRVPASLADRRSARAPKWQRVVIGAGLAAAAVLAAIFVVRGSGPNTEAATGGAPPRPRAGVAAPGTTTLIRSGVDYSAASLDALARSLAAHDAVSGTLKAAPTEPTKFGQATGVDRNPADVQAAFECLQRGTGLATSGTQLQLQEATFQGTAAYIGVFRIPHQPGGQDRILVIAVSRHGCQPLHVVSQTI